MQEQKLNFSASKTSGKYGQDNKIKLKVKLKMGMSGNARCRYYVIRSIHGRVYPSQDGVRDETRFSLPE